MNKSSTEKSIIRLENMQNGWTKICSASKLNRRYKANIFSSDALTVNLYKDNELKKKDRLKKYMCKKQII